MLKVPDPDAVEHLGYDRAAVLQQHPPGLGIRLSPYLPVDVSLDPFVFGVGIGTKF